MAVPVGSGTTTLGHLVIGIAGGCSITAVLISIVSISLQLKNYRKPLLQRHVVRILAMIPLFALSSWLSLIWFTAASIIEPLRDIYEAFVIYCFFELLTGYLGGERSIIILLHGREPQLHLPPFNLCFLPVDISSPHTFLAIKRGIIQYTVIKIILAIATILMKMSDTFQEGYIGLQSGYFWSGLVYNISMSVALYSLAFFWLCLSQELKPFRPIPKFLNIKLVIFASYWQGFFLAILLYFNVLPAVGHYTPDNLARAIQDALICFEMPFFALSNWYAFSYRDFMTQYKTASRLPVLYAIRDASGLLDVWCDIKHVYKGENYVYQAFEPREYNMSLHYEGEPRMARLRGGLRYEKGGRGKYWISMPSTSKKPLLGDVPTESEQRFSDYGSLLRRHEFSPWGVGEDLNMDTDEKDEVLFATARTLEFGDYNV